MPNFKVSYYKNLLSSDGHNFKCLQQKVAVNSKNPIEALKLAHQEVTKTNPSVELNADSVEVAPVTQAAGTSLTSFPSCQLKVIFPIDRDFS